MIKQISAAMFAATLLWGCAQQNVQSNGPTADQAAANRARPYVEGRAALSRYTSSRGCVNADAATVKAKIAELQRQVRLLNTAGFYQYEGEARQRHTTLAFAYADTALKKRCFGDADKAYRELISFYVGSAYGGIRDRAKIGIDDVRRAKAGRR